MSGEKKAWPANDRRRTPEFRREQSERAKQRWGDPEYAARTRAALAANFKKRWADPEKRAKALDQLFYNRCSPIVVNSLRTRLQDPERARLHAEQLKRIHTDPEIIARKRKALKEFWSSPDRKAWVAKKNRKMGITKRGFAVPPALWPEYQRLRVSKKLGAREAGRILGLVK